MTAWKAVATLKFLIPSMLMVLFIVMGCGEPKREHAETQQTTSESWQYPVRLGDSRAKVHELLGAASRSTDVLEEYPSSGVSVWYNEEGRLNKIWFAGEGCSIYSGNDGIQRDPLPTDHQIIFGITGHSKESGFREILGPPQKNEKEGHQEVRCIWRSQGYLIDALFLAVDYQQDIGGRVSAKEKGTLIWFEIARAI
jgi:hypothetical protein